MIDTSDFTGTAHYHKFGPWRDVLTDGALYVAQEGHAFWLMDMISAHLMESKWHKKDYFAVAELRTNNNEGDFLLTDGNENKIAAVHLDYTSYPDEYIKLYCSWDGERWTIMVPSEY